MDNSEEEFKITRRATISANINNRKRKFGRAFQDVASSLVTGTRNIFNNMSSRVTRNNGGSSTGGRSNGYGKKKNGGEPTVVAGEVEFVELLEKLEVEIHQDPYRGLRADQQSIQMGGIDIPKTPWHKCVWGSLEPVQDMDPSDLEAKDMVRHVGGCACPSLKAWTRKKMEAKAAADAKAAAKAKAKKNNKSRKRQRSGDSSPKNNNEASADDDVVEVAQPIFTIGLRPEDSKYRCPCDYNPMCLGTLGGVVNDILTKRCQTMEEGNANNATITNNDDDEIVAVAVHVGDATESSSNNKSNCSSKDVTSTVIIHDEVDVVDVSSPSAQKQGMQSNGTSNHDHDGEIVDVKKNQGQDEDDVFAFTGNDTIERDASTTGSEMEIDTTPTSTKVRSTSLAKKMRRPLQEENGDTPPENPSDIYFNEDYNLDGSKTQYSSATQQEIDRVRRSIDIPCEKIRSYVYRRLGFTLEPDENNNGLTIDKYMQILEQWNQALTFVNPLIPEKPKQLTEGTDRIRLSIPPGIENLGATCYLNTQLQCLAQNTVFLNGIFSWKEVNSTHRMNSVMTKLQHLLARMQVGGDSKLSTLDFSNALGLEHDEQQDPNEFARLLFERMDESFQQCDDGDLANLLQRIFHGTTTYETVCETCEHSSERSEGFMDLNLPIVKREKKEYEKKGDIKSALEAQVSSKNAETDVQYCLDQYICAEMLEGDNQYFCSKCNCKRDAKRVLKLTELPPVLNLQLSRYVFDMKEFCKKKLTDEVSLPKTLYVRKSDSTRQKYLLCAVMRHQGTSAYRGHYVAEAMDWLTGQWFEFNDTIVKLLPDGPSCGYEPTDDGQVPKGNGMKSISGSQDAYNMYYVSESYLIQHSAEAIGNRAHLSSCKAEDDDGVLGKLSRERDSKYRALADMCLQDGQVSNRLQRRKNGILQHLFHDASSLILDESFQNDNVGAEEPVWVGADFLRDFLRCDPDLDGQLNIREPVLKHQQLLCPHNRLHPRTARQGKLLPRSQYDAYTSLLQGERKLLCQQSATDDPGSPTDCEIIPSRNLFCDICADSYCKELKEKLNLLKSIKDLYHVLLPPVDDKALDMDEEVGFECAEDEFAYAVSRITVTKFKKCVVSLLKPFKDYDEGFVVDESKKSKENPRIAGLDALDISSFADLQLADEDEKSSPEGNASTGKEISQPEPDSLDKFFNTNITCSHRNSNELNKKNRVGWVSWNNWVLLKKIFPHAIEHKQKRVSIEENNPWDNQDSGCAACRGEKEALETMKGRLSDWAKGTKQNFELKELIDGKRTFSRDMEVHNFTCAINGCRLVHRADIQTWRKGIKTINTTRKTKSMDINQLKDFVVSAMFPNTHAVVLEFERLPVERLLASLRSLICREHKRVIKDAIFKSGSGNSAAKHEKRSPSKPEDSEVSKPENNDASNFEDSSHCLADGITVLSDVEYRAYINSLADLLNILYPEKTACPVGSASDPVQFDDDKPYLKDIEANTNSYHPAINMSIGRDEEKVADGLLIFSLESSCKEFQLTPAVCSCPTCAKEFAPVKHRVNFEDEDKIESISIDSGDDSKPAAKKFRGAGTASSDPIVVEMDVDDYHSSSPGTFPLRAFEVHETNSVDEALSQLQVVSALPKEEESGGLTKFLRRSSRSRKTHYPSGPLLREDSIHVGMHHNFAAVRLLLYEKCEVPLSGRKVTLVLSAGDGTHRVQNLISEHNPKLLSDLVEILKGQVEQKDASPLNFDPSKHLVILYQRDTDFSASGFQDSLLDSFLQTANLESSDASDKNKDRKRNRPSERGFRGTLLSSSSSVPAEGDDAEKDGGKEGEEVDSSANEKTAAKEDRRVTLQLSISEISDEEKEDSLKESSSEQHQGAVSSSDSDNEKLPEKFENPCRVPDDRSDDLDDMSSTRVVPDDDTSSIEEQVGNDTNHKISPTKSEGEDRVEIEEHPDFKLVYDFLMAMVEQPANQSLAFRTVTQVMSESIPSDDQNALVDRALQQYNSNMFEGSDSRSV